MHTQQLTARFPTGDEMNAALADLRRSGAYQCDQEGAFIYQKVARAQISEFMKSKKS